MRGVLWKYVARLQLLVVDVAVAAVAAAAGRREGRVPCQVGDRGADQHIPRHAHRQLPDPAGPLCPTALPAAKVHQDVLLHSALERGRPADGSARRSAAARLGHYIQVSCIVIPANLMTL